MDNDEDEDSLFGDLDDGGVAAAVEMNSCDIDLNNNCKVELEAYLTDNGMKLKKETNKKEYNNPLEWWRENEDKYLSSELAKLFLRIPASSAPSERIWSRTSQVLSLKRARINDDVASGIVFVKENVDILIQYYNEVTMTCRDTLPFRLSGLPDCFNTLKVDDEIDVGQDLF
eukprot:CCRYP_014871-RA/>CCRYP_014871-RA protein AED:0.76 eAED:0.51 QI:0/0/0/0.5/1/1/2/0/171